MTHETQQKETPKPKMNLPALNIFIFTGGAWIQVPKIMIIAPVNTPARRLKRSLTGPVRKTAGIDPML